MKKIAAIVAAAGIVGFAGAALAHHNDDHNPPGNANGVYGCETMAAGEHQNPGKMWQALKESARFQGMNPKEIADDVNQDSPGALLHLLCGNPD